MTPWRIAIGIACVLVDTVLSWVLLFGALAGNWWAIAGLVYAVTLSVSTGLVFGD